MNVPVSFALEAQHATIQELVKLVDGLSASQGQMSPRDRNTFANVQMGLYAIAQAPAVFLSPAIHAQLKDAVAAYPEEGDTSREEMLWRPTGWLYSPAPLVQVRWRLPEDIAFFGGRELVPIQGVVWNFGLHVQRSTGEVTTELGIHGFSHARVGDTALHPTLHIYYREGETIGRRDPDPDQGGDQRDFPDEMWQLVQWVLVLNTFLKQTLLRTDEVPAERHLRKRWQRQYRKAAPPIHVVALRQVAHVPKPIGDEGLIEVTPEPVVWHCQWIVRGHWRRQWHPSTRTHEVQWIDSYLKGPEDQPLKAPAATVYAARR